LGILLLFCSLLLLPVPGPGAFPVFIAGLSILSINHHWAKRILKRFRTEGKAVVEKIFVANPWVMTLLDVFGICLLTVGLWLLIYFDAYLRIFGFSAIILALTVLLYNRRRYKKISIFNSKH
ncbi:MAG: PGPGW domain-containing protein, partial [Patescibacteria group bacterium]